MTASLFAVFMFFYSMFAGFPASREINLKVCCDLTKRYLGAPFGPLGAHLGDPGALSVTVCRILCAFKLHPKKSDPIPRMHPAKKLDSEKMHLFDETQSFTTISMVVENRYMKIKSR